MKIVLKKAGILREKDVILPLHFKKKGRNMNQFRFGKNFSESVLDIFDSEKIEEKEKPESSETGESFEASINEEQIIDLMDFKKLLKN